MPIVLVHRFGKKKQLSILKWKVAFGRESIFYRVSVAAGGLAIL